MWAAGATTRAAHRGVTEHGEEAEVERFVVGTGTVGANASGVRPRSTREVVAVPGLRLWAAGYGREEIVVSGASGVEGQLVTAGDCLATVAERREALMAAADGEAEVVRRLPGSFLAVVNTRSGLWVLGDRAGVVPVYWVRYDGGVWWSTSAAVLAALVGAAPDPAVLLAELTVTGVDVQGDGSRFEGVRRVPPGCVLVPEDDGSGAAALPVRDGLRCSAAEGARRLREALALAVERRVERARSLSADLSGGVDSGSVVALAARSSPVLAVTYTDGHMAESDDVRYARRLAAATDTLTHRIVDGREERAAHFDGLQDPGALPMTDTPALALALLAIKDAQMAPAVAHGSGHHLTGRGGDNVLGAAPGHLVDLILAGRRGEAIRRAARYARVRNAAVLPVWRRLHRTARTRYPVALEQLATALAAPVSPERPGTEAAANLAWCGTTAPAAWLTGNGRRAVAEVVAARAAVANPGAEPGEVQDRLALEFMATSHAAFDLVGRQRWGLAIHAPFLDTPVVDACMAIASHDRVHPDVYKPLARAALHGLVPEWLLHRRTKTDFSAGLHDGLARNEPVLRRILVSSQLAGAGLIDPRPALAALAAAAAGAPAPLGALHSLIVTEVWLAQLATRNRTTWWANAPRRSPV
nr:albusnodin/ikarugamycin family macrolactam cyclase [Streptomyces alkaliphilus]